MIREDIIRMAREAEFYFDGKNTQKPLWVETTEQLERFAALVAAAERESRAFELAECYRCGWDGGVKAEREACAKLCDQMDHDGVMVAMHCAEAIRARGKK